MKLSNTENLMFLSTLVDVTFHFSHTVHSFNGCDGDLMASDSLKDFLWFNYFDDTMIWISV